MSREVQSRFYANTHYSQSHLTHHEGIGLVATQWQLVVPDASRQSGIRGYKDLGHVPFSGQTTLDMFRK